MQLSGPTIGQSPRPDPLDQCRALLTDATAALRAAVPTDRTGALLALLRVGDAIAFATDQPRTAPPGWNLALRLCLESDNSAGSPPGDLHPWADRFLADCAQLAHAELALARCATGSLQLQQRAPNDYVAWPTSKRLPADQRERADLAWWSAHLARQVAPQHTALLAERPQIAPLLAQNTAEDPWGYVAINPAVAYFYQQLGQADLAPLACQHSSPPDASIGGATFARYADILGLLIGWLHLERDRQPFTGTLAPAPQRESDLVAVLAAALNDNPATIAQILRHVILDRDNATYHSGALGQAAPPLIRLDDQHLAWSALGLLGEPYIFLAHELRRRHAQDYHNSAHLREEVFRRDLYHLFGDKRFVLSPGRVELKRGNAARTDIDALIFDRKTGTLGIFELKAQDPFARSVEERQRQRDHFFHANRQVSAALEWVQRHSPDDLLSRFGERTAKQFRVQKVHPFVLGRYLAHFDDGPEPDRRAAWGNWPEVLRLTAGEPFGPNDRNPLATLHTRLRDAPPPAVPPTTEIIATGDLRLHIYASFAAIRAAE
jgi:hypothetical protein